MQTSEPYSKIVVCSDTDFAKEQIEKEFSTYRICVFSPEKEEFLLENAKDALKEAYISEVNQKIILLSAKSFRMEAQNSLLKLLEEPPKNIVFIILAPAKNVLLPTIRSRMPIEEINFDKQRSQSGLNLKKLHEKEIFEFIKAHSKMSKSELKAMVQAIVYEAIHEANMSFTQKEMSHFQNLIELCELNARPQNIFATLLLTIMKRRRL